MAKLRFAPVSYATLFKIGFLFMSFLNFTYSRQNKSRFHGLVEIPGVLKEESSCTDDVQKVLEYIKFGETKFLEPKSSDVILVLSVSGAGKTTLVQFIGNVTNQLYATCNIIGYCFIVDEECGSIEEENAYSSFLPKLVVNTDTNTSYFDMPGYNDNTSTAVELARAYFLERIIGVTERIKTLVLASHRSFYDSDMSSFKFLMNSIVKIFKNPLKFAASIAMISTAADPMIPHDQLMHGYTEFLNLTLKPAVDSLFEGDNRRRVNDTIDAILASETGNINEANHLEYFIHPVRNGSLNELGEYVLNRLQLLKLANKDLEFTVTEPDDIGNPLSERAVLLLERVRDCIEEGWEGASAGSVHFKINDAILKKIHHKNHGNPTLLSIVKGTNRL